ncbi:protein transport protein sec61 subunit gamma-2 [Quercus suber]|uniref:Protein transport protein sec61 subunit gamma-2 n=1 Tax=Quercus suber TaxID=58331 RepID=A0AAW0IW33_QUESU
MEAIDSVFDPLREFAKDSVRLVKRCHKPDRKDYEFGVVAEVSLDCRANMKDGSSRPMGYQLIV